MSRRSSRWTAAAIAVVGFGSLPTLGTEAFAAPSTYTWSGAAGNGNWSSPGNWTGDQAPSAGTPVNLAFPAGTCASTATTCATTDDISGLVVDSLSIGVVAGSATQYSIAGPDPLNLDGGITVTAPSGPANSTTGTPSISDNVVLGAANTWNVDSGLQVTGNLSGTFALTIDTVQGTNLSLEGPSNEVGAISIAGPAGVSGSAGGVVGATQDLDGAGATPGSIQVTDAELFFGNDPSVTNLTVGDVATSHALLVVDGAPLAANVTLDPTSSVSYRALTANPPTNNAPLLTTTGTTTLATAALSIAAACNIPLNTSFPIVSATNLSGTFTTANGQPIANGDVIAAANPTGGACAAPDLKITYTTTGGVPEVQATITNDPPTYPTTPVLPTPPNSPTPPTTSPTTAGYRLADSAGDVLSYGVASYGSLAGVTINKPVVGIASDACTGGYWLAAADGGVFSYNAPFYGSAAGITLDKPVVAITADPTTGGYWLAAADGGVFSYNAPFYGSATPGTTPSGQVVGAASA